MSRNGWNVMLPCLDIVIPVYKNAKMTMDCIESIHRQRAEIGDWRPRLIVIDDSPGDEVGSFLADAHRAGVIDVLLVNERNVGFVKSVNLGLDEARKRKASVLLVNSDTITFAGTMREILDVAGIDPMIGFVNPRSNNASIASFPLAREGDGIDHSDVHACHDAWNALKGYLPRMTFTPTAVGFYMFINATIIQNFGTLDESFGVGYEEENDYVLRANKVGFRSVFANHAYAYHAGSASFSLTDIDLGVHRNKNFALMNEKHPEFLALVRRYDASPHYQAECLLRNLLPDAAGKLRLSVNMLTMGAHYNGTSEVIVNLVKHLSAMDNCPFDVTVIVTDEVRDFFGLASLAGISFSSVVAGHYAIALHPGQPFDFSHLDVISALAPINVYIMHDAIAVDCGYLSSTQDLDILWGSAMRHAHGIYYISDFVRTTFENRFQQHRDIVYFTQSHPTQPSCYAPAARVVAGDHIYVAGNHFAHKAAGRTALAIAEAFPATRVMVTDDIERSHERIDVFKSGEIDEVDMANLLGKASVVVLPSFYEGFGFTLMHALAQKKPVAARDIPATRAILSDFDDVSGVFLFSSDAEMIDAVNQAILAGASHGVNARGADWESWTRNFVKFLQRTINTNTVYPQLIRRLEDMGMVRNYLSNKSTILFDDRFVGFRERHAISYSELKNLPSDDFICALYNLILKRNPDSPGFRSHLAAMNAGTPRPRVVSDFLGSDEYRRNGSKVTVRGLTLAGWLHDHM